MAFLHLEGRDLLVLPLSATCGYVDAVALRQLGAFVSFMSGNTTSTGIGLALQRPATFLPAGVAIFGFVTGATLGGVLHGKGEPGAQRVLLLAIGVLLLAQMALAHTPFDSANGEILILALAMGALNTAVSRLGRQKLSIGFVTGTLYAMSEHLALALQRRRLADSSAMWDTPAYRALLLFLVWVAFLGGAVGGAVATEYVPTGALLLPLAFVMVLAIAVGTMSESTPARPAASPVASTRG